MGVAAILVMCPEPFKLNFVPASSGVSIWKGDVHEEAILAPLWGQKMKIALHKFLLITLLEQ